LAVKPSSTSGVKATSTSSSIETIPHKTGTGALGTSTATITFNGAHKPEAFNKLTVSGLLLLVFELVL
jgi:hypothetical protein